jgi:RHS repeat-associated protein
VQSEVRSDFGAQSPEPLVYDGDGNLVRDGRWVYSWDAENRLVRVMNYGAADRAGWRRVDWAYDALGRRIRQTSYVLSNGVWVVTEDLRFVSDPVWFGRHIAELNATNHAVVRSYVWALDLSETLDGAGGVGGLLWVRMASGPASGTQFVTYDSNGNVWQLVSASTGTATARYEYGPFGEPLRTTGLAGASNPFRFSGKRSDPARGLVLFEYRAYSARTGCWLSGDPMENDESLNAYNATLDSLADYEGRDGQKPRKPRPPKLPNPLKRAAYCAAECAAKHGVEKIGKWIHAQFYCGKLGDECLDKGGLPGVQDVFTGDLGIGRDLWYKFVGCFIDCMGGSHYGIVAQLGAGRFTCNDKSRRVDWEFELLLSVIINGKGYVVHQERINGSCGTRQYMICCVVCG